MLCSLFTYSMTSEVLHVYMCCIDFRVSWIRVPPRAALSLKNVLSLNCLVCTCFVRIIPLCVVLCVVCVWCVCVCVTGEDANKGDKLQ